MSVSTPKARFSKSEVENFVEKRSIFVLCEICFYKKPILVNNICQRFIISNNRRLTSSNGTNVMKKKHSITCIKAKDLTPETQPRITSLFKETSQVTLQ